MKSGLQNFEHHLKKHGLRLTSERQKLVELILSIKGHFNSDQVLNEVRSRNLSVSRATIYRLFPVLIDADLIRQSLLTTGGQTHFEVTWNKAHHDHLICTSCRKIIEFQDSTIEILQREVANRYGFILENHVMELIGRCRNCRDA